MLQTSRENEDGDTEMNPEAPVNLEDEVLRDLNKAKDLHKQIFPKKALDNVAVAVMALAIGLQRRSEMTPQSASKALATPPVEPAEPTETAVEKAGITVTKVAKKAAKKAAVRSFIDPVEHARRNPRKPFVPSAG